MSRELHSMWFQTISWLVCFSSSHEFIVYDLTKEKSTEPLLNVLCVMIGDTPDEKPSSVL